MSDISVNVIKISLFIIVMLTIIIMYNLSKKKDKYIKPFAIIGILFSTLYIVWRLVFTLPLSNLGIIVGSILIFFEFIGFLQSVVFRALFASSKKITLEKDNEFKTLPLIDVFISTYNESVDIIKRTAVSALQIDYPKKLINIYIGDDGRREEIRELAASLKVNYVTRDNNLHAKAGNVNNLLSVSRGEFILLLDADMIPHRSILQRMIHYFESSKTGFVQSPQAFYNLDPYQFNMYMDSNIPNEQDFFMRAIQQKRSMHNAVLHIGTNAIFRRTAIEAIGGIPTGSITEDMATGMLIQNLGYKSYYVNEILALGLSPESLTDLVKQRDRWCRGTIQVFKKYKPYKMKGLNLWQKILYLDGSAYWLFGISKIIYVLSPLIYLYFKLPLFSTGNWDLILMFLPHYLGIVYFFNCVSQGSRNTLWSRIYETSLAPYIAKSFILELLLNKKPKFNVTPKGVLNTKKSFRFKLAIPHIFMLSLIIIGIGINYNNLYNEVLSNNYDGVFINVFWSIYNATALIASLFLFIDRRRFRITERIPIKYDLRAVLNSSDINECSYLGLIKDISEKGVRMELINNDYDNLTDNKEIQLTIENIGIIKGKIIRIKKSNFKIYIIITFLNIEDDEFYNINQLRFDIHNKYMQMPHFERGSSNFHNILYSQFKTKKGKSKED